MLEKTMYGHTWVMQPAKEEQMTETKTGETCHFWFYNQMIKVKGDKEFKAIGNPLCRSKKLVTNNGLIKYANRSIRN